MIISRSAARRIGHRPAYGDAWTDILGLNTKFLDVASGILGGNAAKTAQAQAQAQALAAQQSALASEASSGAIKVAAIAGAIGIAVLGAVVAFTKRPRAVAGYRGCRGYGCRK